MADGDPAQQVGAAFRHFPGAFDRVSPIRRQVLVAHLASLDRSFQERGGRPRVEKGDPRLVVPRVAKMLQVETIHFNREVTPYGVARDRSVAERASISPHEGSSCIRPGR